MKRSSLWTALGSYFFLLTVFLGFWTQGVNGSLASSALEAIGDQNITPAGSRGVRPDSVRIGDTIYVNYLQIKPQRKFRFIKMDIALKNFSVIDAFSGMYSPTDARVCLGVDGKFWYAFETILDLDHGGPGHKPSRRNFLNLASYKTDAEGLTLEQSKNNVIEGSYLGAGHVPPPETMLTDDPTPFYSKGNYYVLLKSFSPNLYAKVFSKDFQKIDSFTLDLSKYAGDMKTSVNSIVRIGQTNMLITGLFAGPPNLSPHPGPPNLSPHPGPSNLSPSKTAIVAIPLTEDLRAATGKIIFLSQNNRYETNVSGARYENGKLYIVYNELSRNFYDRNTTVIVKVYDTNTDYRELASQEVYRGPTVDGHATLEIVGNKAYVFYFTAQEQIRVKVYLLNYL